MNRPFFQELEEILETSAPHEKIEKFRHFYQAFLNNETDYNHDTLAKVFEAPSFQAICQIVHAKKLPKRTALSTVEGKAKLLHAIAHIEYSAIDLALDAAYRFKNMPNKFYHDWLEVADDEIRHFLMIEKLLHKIGYRYGDIKVHAFLFDISMKSLTLVERMATVPRYLEASGLDSNPKVMEKLSHLHDELSKEIYNALEIILHEEIDHVKKGDYWFKWACEKENIDPATYFDIVETILPGAKKKKPYVNVEDRKKAGFSCDEISVLTDQKCD